MKTLLSLLLISVSFAQVPTPRPEPASSAYDVSELNLLPSYSRASYKAATGKDAPAFDVNKPSKAWFDSTQSCANAGSVTYKSLQGYSLVPFTLSACDASAVNLPPDDSPTLPPVWTLNSDGVRFSGVPDLDTQLQVFVQNAERSIDLTVKFDPASFVANIPDAFSTTAKGLAAEAKDVCAWINGNNLIFKGGNDPACDNPKPLADKYGAVLLAYAQAAAAIQDEMGTVPGTPCKYCNAVAQKAPLPVRDLYPDEQVGIASMMGGVIVRRIAPAMPVAVQGGTFTDADRANLLQVLQILKNLTGQK